MLHRFAASSLFIANFACCTHPAACALAANCCKSSCSRSSEVPAGAMHRLQGTQKTRATCSSASDASSNTRKGWQLPHLSRASQLLTKWSAVAADACGPRLGRALKRCEQMHALPVALRTDDADVQWTSRSCVRWMTPASRSNEKEHRQWVQRVVSGQSAHLQAQ